MVIPLVNETGGRLSEEDLPIGSLAQYIVSHGAPPRQITVQGPAASPVFTADFCGTNVRLVP
jgi:hypothetical protein